MENKVGTIILLLLFSLVGYAQDLTSTAEYDVAKSAFTLKIKNCSAKRLIVYGGWGTVENHAIKSCIYKSLDKCLTEEYYSLSDTISSIIIEPNDTFCRRLNILNWLDGVKIEFTVEYKYVFEYGEWQKFRKEYQYNLK